MLSPMDNTLIDKDELESELLFLNSKRKKILITAKINATTKANSLKK